jgi:hypothetical protein
LTLPYGSAKRTAAHVEPLGMRSDAKLLPPLGVKTGWVLSTKLVCDELQTIPVVESQHPMTCESMAGLLVPLLGLYIVGIETVPVR